MTRLRFAIFLAAMCIESADAQQALPWPEVRNKFEATNPTLIAGRIGIDQSKAADITAYLRPNPNVTGVLDQIDPFTKQPPLNGSGGDSYNPFRYASPSGAIDYLHERQHKRELRRESAQQATAIANSQLADQELKVSRVPTTLQTGSSPWRSFARPRWIRGPI